MHYNTYTAGYICRKVYDKLQATSLQHKDLILCIHVMCGPDESEGKGTNDWINAIERGGSCGASTIRRTVFFMPSKTWFTSTSQDLLYGDSLTAARSNSLLH